MSEPIKTTYVVIYPNGHVLGEDLTAVEAMDAILSHDSRGWELRDEDGWLRLWTHSPECGPGGKRWSATMLLAPTEDRQDAIEFLASIIVRAGGGLYGPYAMPMSDYKATMTNQEGAAHDDE